MSLRKSVWYLVLLGVVVSAMTSVRADDEQLTAQIEELVALLDADTISERDIAEQNLLNLVDVEGVGPEKFLAVLPKPNDSMPPAVRERLSTIRKMVEQRLAAQAIEASKVSLEAINWPLADVIKKLEELTGNKIVDNREPDAVAASPQIIMKVENEPFWSVMDQVMDQAQLSQYAYAGEDALALVARGEGEGQRFGRACYSGPFRFEVIEVSATRGMRNPSNQALRLDLEIGWEPRLRPIALTQQMTRLDAITPDGERLAPAQEQQVFNIEVQEGTCASTITVPFELPDRSVEEIMLLGGKITALVPGKREKFRFDDLKSKEPIVKTLGGVKVTLERVVQNGPIWEVHMNLELENDNGALASHRGWVFNNITYLVGDDGEPIDHAGFETTKQTATEVGIAYLFDLPEGIDGLSWVYESPVSIVERDYEYQLEGIKLP
ncbi:hypothetical protein NG895_19235 [Aeoliella sp. ICT_H6.2]|uniref:Uncharacterized protein n=1 Tax=Aeoliella straminimaris TaxID=2954799 RepID=A0A9X2FGJ5_9BACT|nr:hypothetical protein [Aeoliella straminimaris]MCO6046039.1 hypothetical protein [Aeoliella straminimaris]